MTNGLFDLSGRVAVVTGAASGLGQAIAIGLARHGADIAAVYRSESQLARTLEAVEAAHRKAVPVHCDVTQPDDVARLFEQVDQAFGQVDILVNVAGVGSHVRPEDLVLEEWNQVMDTNVTGFFLCAQAAARRMIQRGRGGSIINMSSIAGSIAVGRGNFAYTVSKGAINQMTRELAVEWAKHGIRVNAIQPCQIRTPGLQALIDDPQFDSAALINRFLIGIPMNRLGEPDEVVWPVVFLASDAAAYITGAALPVDGGNLALNAGGSHTW